VCVRVEYFLTEYKDSCRRMLDSFAGKQDSFAGK